MPMIEVIDATQTSSVSGASKFIVRDGRVSAWRRSPSLMK